ncbi:MAG: winged helix-turn-helix domain-containing protein [Candidatus Omnitrophota bacterium]
MITRIGIVSGEILMVLEKQNRSIRLKEFSEFVNHPPEMILMSIGWLAREGYVQVKEEEDYIVSRIK